MSDYDWRMESNPLRLRRENLGLSLRDVGTASGIPFPTLHRIERNVNGARVEHIAPLAKSLLMDEMWLYQALSLYYELLVYASAKDEFLAFQDAVLADLDAARSIVERARASVTPPRRSGEQVIQYRLLKLQKLLRAPGKSIPRED